MFALADVNSFYASCKKVFRPDLRNKPVVVLSNNDGCVITRSAEAKRLGIKMGIPWFQLKTAQFPPYRKTAVTAASGGNLGCGPQDLKEAEHTGDHHSTAAGPHESNVHQEKF